MNIQKETTLKKRIFMKDVDGNLLETEEWQVYKRVSDFLGNDDVERKEFFDIMNDGYFLPNSPCLVSAGVEGGMNMQVACFVLPIEDDLGKIFDTLKDMAMVQKMGGGVGFNFSNLRPKGSRVGSTNGVASGVVSFIKIFDSVIEEIKQGGVRRGAAMGILNVDHLDIFDFIDCKNNLNVSNNFNLSVAITDKFMTAVQNNELWCLSHDSVEQVRYVEARTLYNKIVENAHRTGEPGIVFIDEINRKHKLYTGIEEKIESVNACGELPLLPYECCCLGSLNVSKIFSDHIAMGSIVYDNLISIAIKFLNRIIDKTSYPLPQNKEIALKHRKIGLGVMGYADLIIKLGYEYGSVEALRYTESLANYLKEESRKEGLKYGNKVVNSIAPTGTLSILADCSSGIEPLFALEQHIDRMDEHFVIVPSIVEWYADKTGLFKENLKNEPLFRTANDIPFEAHLRTQAVWQRYIDNSISKTINLPSNATVQDVDDSFMLAYNLKCKGFTVYRDGCRDTQVLNHKAKIKTQEVIEVPSKDGVWKEFEAVGEPIEFTLPDIRDFKPFVRPREDILTGITEKLKIGCGNLYITVNSDDIGICEVFTNTGRAGGCSSQSEATSRLVSIALRAGIDPMTIVEQLKGIRCPSTIRQKGLKCTSCPDGIGRLIEKVYNGQKEPIKPIEKEKKKEEKKTKIVSLIVKDDLVEEEGCNDCSSCSMKEQCNKEPEVKEVCPDCGVRQEQHGNCFKCLNCGYSKCGS